MALGIRPIAANPIASLPSAATTPPATVDFGWFTGLSSRNITKTLTVAVIASGLIAPIAPPVAPAAAGSWFTPLSEPVRTKNFPTSQQAALFFVAPSGEVVTADKWFAQFREPVRRVAAATRYEQLVTDTDPVVTFSWFGQLRDPMRRVPTWPRHEQTITDTDPIVSFGWFGNFADPTRRKPNIGPYRDNADWVAVETSIPWFGNLSSPLFRTRWTPTDQQASPYFPPVVQVDYGWFSPLSTPTLPKSRMAALTIGWLGINHCPRRIRRREYRPVLASSIRLSRKSTVLIGMPSFLGRRFAPAGRRPISNLTRISRSQARRLILAGSRAFRTL